MTFRLRRAHDLDLVDTPEPDDWRNRAACAAACRNPDHPAGPDWWDAVTATPTEDQHRDAIEVCAVCPVTAECLAAAHAKLDGFSIRGGMLPSDWRAKAKRGAA